MPQFKFLALILSFHLSAKAESVLICNDEDDKSKIANAVCIFSKPLLVGASLTQGQGANPGGPVSLIAESLSPGARINNIAQSGTKSVDSLKDHTIPSEKPSIVIGMDLFFWDAVKNDCDVNFEKSTKKFIKLYQKKNIPMILGKLAKNIPFPAGYRLLNNSICTDKINKLLEEECTSDKNCIIYDPKDCFSKMEQEKWNLYFVDKLHLSLEGNKFCANEFIASRKYQKLKCQSTHLVR